MSAWIWALIVIGGLLAARGALALAVSWRRARKLLSDEERRP